MPDLPTGTLTLLFTDIEGSTRLLQRLGGARYGSVLGVHHRILRGAISGWNGVEVKTEGDSFFAVFPQIADAVTAAVEAQRALAAERWPDDGAINVRMGIHTGEVSLIAGEYVGLDVHRAARVAAAAHGGQVLLSDAAASLVTGKLPTGVSVLDLGEHRLRDLDRPEHLWQLVIGGLRADYPPVHAVSTRFDVLPREATAFVGRERELGRGRQLLDSTRLLTLTGPGGTGKTRLAQRLAAELGGDFADGVAFVPLAAISDPELVAPSIRQTLGLTEQPGQPASRTLIERLHDRELLLVLDNFEQVLTAAPMVAELLAATGRLKIIVTSRAALHLDGEQEFPVPPLEVATVAQAEDLATLSQSDAVALFIQHARTVRPDFQLTAANARAIVEICARLDGLPLAIELAASRIKLLPPHALLDRLEHRLDLLQSTGADRSDRQRTLRGAIDWSYGLLAEGERTLFRRLAIFVGGWALDDAEAVVGAAGALEVDILGGLAALVDHSLVRQAEGDDEARFGTLETIREYGREQLEAAGELGATARAHAARYAALASEAESRLTSGPKWPDRLEREHANMRAALSWLAEDDIETALSTAGSLWRFWHLRGHLREGAALLSDMLARPTATAPSRARAKALLGLAGLVYWQVNYELARQSYEEALAIAHAAGDHQLEAEAQFSLAFVRAIERDWDGAIRDYQSARALFEEQDAELMVAWADMGIGMVTTLRGEHEAALRLLSQARKRFVELGDGFALRNILSVESRALMQLGRREESTELNRQVIQLAHGQRDVTSLSAALLDRASLAAQAARPERGARLIGAARRIVEESGGQPPPELINRIDGLPIVEQQLDAATLERLIDEGRRMTADESVAYALADDP
jgi:predicted ATPase/class 3 adenylate cyclase